MALRIAADAVRALIPDGVYTLQALEQRDAQRVVLTFTLASRSGGHMLQIDTSETKVLELFQHLLTSTRPAERQRRPRPATVAKRPAAPVAVPAPTQTPPPAESTTSVPPGVRPKRQRRQAR
jgi:hypothetical protein